MKHALYTFLLCFFVLEAVNAQVPDSSFGTNGKKVLDAYSQYEEVSSGLLQPNGKIVIGGFDYDETFYFPSISVWRVNSNGSVDRNFGQNGHVRISGSPYGGSEYGGYLALQPDNKIVGLGSDFDRDGIIKGRIVLFRLKANGTFDSSFGTNGKAYANFGGFTNVAGAILLKPDGKIVVTGNLQQNRNGTGRVELVQFLPNGKIDSSFGTNGIAASGLAYQQQGVALALLPGNKILAGFQYVTGSTYKSCLIQYNANGTVDTTFGAKGIVLNKNTAVNYSAKMALAIQADGKIVEYATTSGNNLLYRYNADGSADHSFGVNGRVTVPVNNFVSLSVVIDNHQRVLINTPDFALLRYLPDGKPDSSFGVNGKLSTNFSDAIPGSYARSEQLILQPDSKIIGIGYLDLGNGLEAFALARFKNTAEAKAATNAIAKSEAIVLYPNPVNNILNVKGLDINASYMLTITDEKGNVKAVKQINHTGLLNWNIQNLRSGLYYLNVTSIEYKTTVTFIKQ